MSSEANFDGLVGPTHNYSGLSFGNVASTSNERRVANPKKAALQGLAKMRALARRGFAQAVIPPHERPDVHWLRALGFRGTDAEIIARAAKEEPALLAAASSASAMWTANAATVSPSADTDDGRVHLSPASLANKLHRSFEHETTRRLLQAIFPDRARFVVHEALPAHPQIGDEGAANHTRFGEDGPGVELFVYGGSMTPGAPTPLRFPARQTLEASRAIARRHGLSSELTVFAQQDPSVIDEGVFHNDVISVGHRRLFFAHERAFVGQRAVLAELERKVRATGAPLTVLTVDEQRVSVADAVKTYLFNSQLLQRSDGKYLLVVPEECREHAGTATLIDELPSISPIDEILVFDLRESMQNGGGPACLRLRVELSEGERASVTPRVWLTEERYAELVAWVERHYRDRLLPEDLADPKLLDEGRAALDTLTQLLDLGSVYPFQREEVAPPTVREDLVDDTTLASR